MKKMFKEHDLVKILSIMILLVVVLTWIIPTGTFSTGATLTEGELGRIGLVHLFYGFTFAIQNYSIQIAFLLLVGIFYGVVTKTEMYKTLVSRLAKFGKGHVIGVSLGVSFIIAALASVLNNTMILLLFIPFLITVLRRMGLDKISAFATTFGSILVGVLGATIGTEGLMGFVEYLAYNSQDISMLTEIEVRIGVFVLAYILFNFFNVVYLKKQLEKKTKQEEILDDVFAVEEPKKKKTAIWPIILIMLILFVFAILGFTSWLGIFEIEVFEKFHEWLMKLAIGDFQIFNVILGSSLPNMAYDLVPSFGTWYLFTYSIVLGIATILIAFMSRMKLNEFFTNAWDGMKKVIRPISFLLLAYLVFVFLYWSPIMPSIISALGGITESFNPLVTFLQAFIGSIFNSDFAYLGFSLNGYLGSYTGAEANIVYLIFTTIYGLVQFITPISVFLLFGLSYMDISYKKWMRYIWKFFIGMLVCLLVIFGLLTWI